MILAACFTVPALALHVSGAEKVAFSDIFGWWLPAPGALVRPAVIGLHGCGGLYIRGDLNARESGMAELLRERGFHVLLPDSFTPRGLRELCTVPRARTQASYLPVAPLLILIGALDERTPPAPCVELGNWTPKVMVRVLPDSRHGFDHPSSGPQSRNLAYAAMFEFLERELR